MLCENCKSKIPTVTGLDGRKHVEIGEGKWLSMSWHRMESGRYEVVAYVN